MQEIWFQIINATGISVYFDFYIEFFFQMQIVKNFEIKCVPFMELSLSYEVLSPFPLPNVRAIR